MAGWEDSARRALEEAGLRVESKKVKYTRLTGGSVSEERVTGYSPDGLLKVTATKIEGEEGVKITVVARGTASTRELVRRLEAVGASVDHEEGERTHGVVRRVGESDVGRIVRRILQGP